MFPRWLSWLVLAVLAYLVVVGTRASHERVPSAVAVTQPSVAAEQSSPTPDLESLPPALAQAADVQRWKRAINPDYAARTQCVLVAPAEQEAKQLLWKVTQDTPGSGAAATCGETIPMKFTVWNVKGTPAYVGEHAFALGAREVAAGLDAALVGIRVGGVRTVILAPEALLRDKKSTASKALLNAIGSGRVVIVTVERLG
jgi:hypothetical protein